MIEGRSEKKKWKKKKKKEITTRRPIFFQCQGNELKQLSMV